MNPSDQYKHCNHHHELTDDYEVVDFGDGEFVANKMAIPLLKSLADLGIRTRTHHVDNNGGFLSIILEEDVWVEFQIVNERDSTRTKYNGLPEILIKWCNKPGHKNA